MRKLIAAAIVASFVTAMPVLAAPQAKAEVIERDAKGRPTKVRMDGKEYAICTSDNSDGCINPREAGLSWGNRTAKDWPGRPISRER